MKNINITSISFNPENINFEEIKNIIALEAKKETNIILLPEFWTGQNDYSMESLEGNTINYLKHISKTTNTYIISPMDRVFNNKRFNTIVFIDDNGEIIDSYDKYYPYWSEYEHNLPVSPGNEVKVVKTNIGNFGLATCFDVNFPEIWEKLARMKSDIVFWPSAYSAGNSLKAHALNHHYYIVTSTHDCDCQVFDINGDKIIDEHTPNINISNFNLNLNRKIFHENFNLSQKDKLLNDYKNQISLENYMSREQWFILDCINVELDLSELAIEYDLEELRDYKIRSKFEIDKLRLI